MSQAILLRRQLRRQFPDEPWARIWERIYPKVIPNYDAINEMDQRDARQEPSRPNLLGGSATPRRFSVVMRLPTDIQTGLRTLRHQGTVFERDFSGGTVYRRSTTRNLDIVRQGESKVHITHL